MEAVAPPSLPPPPSKLQSKKPQVHVNSTWDGWMNQAYSRLSTTHGHITDCKMDSVVYAGVSVVIFNVGPSCLGRTNYARQFLGAKPPIQFRHR